VKWELLVVPRILLGRARERELRHLQEFTPQSTWVVFVRFTSTLSVLELSEMSACRKGMKLSRTLHLMRKRHFLRINRIPRKIILSVDFGSGEVQLLRIEEDSRRDAEILGCGVPCGTADVPRDLRVSIGRLPV
jgi:hypothetical protein